MTYRSDIDGLRGVAIILVVLYHAHLGVFTAGYVGVDVFLVISGFVITRLVVEQIDSRCFSFTEFLSRRMRRLFPAAVVVVTATLLVGLFIMSPRDLRMLAGSSVATLCSVANIYFWRLQGYFEDQLPEQPLLHTWSLGLEEQFYLLFPLALIIISRLVSRLRLAALVAGVLASLAFSIWMTGRHPGGAFYLLPARIWEFLLGGVIAQLTLRTAAPAWIRESTAAAGLIVILLAALLISRETPYPGVAAIVPSVAAGMVVWGNASGPTFTRRMLSGQWIVLVGLGSYSLYLWHWPVFALARYYLARDLRPIETISALVLVSVLTYLTWKYVEQSFRVRSSGANRPKPLAAVFGLAIAVIVAAVLAFMRGGLPGRLPEVALAFDGFRDEPAAGANRCHHGSPELVSEGDLCRIAVASPPQAKILLWGDSHANAIAPVMAKLGTERDVEVWQASYSSCPPLLGIGVAHTGGSNHCREFNEMVVQAIRRKGIGRVVLAAYWTFYLPAPPRYPIGGILDPYSDDDDIAVGNGSADDHNMTSGLLRTVGALRKMGVEVWILEQVPKQLGFVPVVLFRTEMRGMDVSRVWVSTAEHQLSQARVLPIFGKLGNSVKLLDPAISLCRDDRCLSNDGVSSFYRDANHLTKRGAEELQPQLAGIFH